MDDLDIVAAKQKDGLWLIRRWSEFQHDLVEIPGHDGRYTEGEMHRCLEYLRLTGKTFLHDETGLRLIP